MPKFSVCTFGCRCNQADSAAIREGLRKAFSETAAAHDADLVVINTCTVTHRTDQQVRQAIRRLHRENPGARLVVTGCYAERAPENLAALPGVALVVGNADKDRLAEIVQADPAERIHRKPLDSGRDWILPSMSRTGGKTRPIVKLQDGCNARCSYCIVPYVRGPARSARPEAVLAEVRSLVEQGFAEIVLTGVHLGAYPDLAGVVAEVLRIPSLGRIRLSSVEPMHFDRALVDLAGSPRLAPHFHIPLQSGSDRVLGRMRRPYSAAGYRDLVQEIAGRIPDVALGTDVLVGFPGETGSDFEETCALVSELPLAYLHVFPFSPREGTEAFSMPGRVPRGEIRRRLRSMLEIAKSKSLSFRRRFAGRVLEAVTLGSSEILTGNYIHARVATLGAPPNRLVEARIEDVRPGETRARVTALTK